MNSTNIPQPASEPDALANSDWKPEKRGDSITGVITARESVESKQFDKTFEVLTVRNGDGEDHRVMCARLHLAQLLAEHDPQVGDGIALTYFGQEPEGKTYLYAMRIQKENGHVPF